MQATKSGHQNNPVVDDNEIQFNEIAPSLDFYAYSSKLLNNLAYFELCHTSGRKAV